MLGILSKFSPNLILGQIVRTDWLNVMGAFLNAGLLCLAKSKNIRDVFTSVRSRNGRSYIPECDQFKVYF